ncbi:hypothetical protein OG883_36445 [Streptomyces sp. NBC_01142]|uniref:hypothetical protein n=1 Tax=Streptomyces sp. NBC_01142 TaxID=2975865 RepID=UPI002254A4F2|nr:hypothetical protein [Streptomyces sp. NBC_01142]MCX4825256.1 hypothetical protein [Streptomyces sp. NBC_01142]
MNRQRRLALLAAPLLVPSVALAPAAVAQGMAEEMPLSVSAAPAAPKCALVLGEPGANGQPTFDLKLTGFAAEKDVTVSSVKGAVDGTTSEDGAFSEEDVPYATYSAKQGNKRTNCSKVAKPPKVDPAKTPAEVTDLTLAVPPKPSGKCDPPPKITFNATVAVAGPGVVKLQFRFSDNTVSPVKTVKFDKAGEQVVGANWPGDTNPPTFTGSALVKIVGDEAQATKAFTFTCT